MAHSSLRTTHCSLLTTCSVVLEVDTSLQDLLHLHGRPLIAAPRGADSAGLNQYRKVRRQQREASFLSNVDLGEHDAEQRGNLRARAAAPTNIHDARELVIPVPPPDQGYYRVRARRRVRRRVRVRVRRRRRLSGRGRVRVRVKVHR